MPTFKNDGPYNTKTLTLVFAWSSIALLASIVWMVLADHSREWKAYQGEFRELQIDMRQASVNAAKAQLRRLFVITRKGSKTPLDGLYVDMGSSFKKQGGEATVEKSEVLSATPARKHYEEQLDAAQAKLESEVEARKKWEKISLKANADYEATNLVFKNTKSMIETLKYKYEHAAAHAPKKAPKYRNELTENEKKAAELNRKLVEIEHERVHGHVAAPALKGEPKGMDVVGPFESVSDGKVRVRGKGTYALAAANRAAILELVGSLRTDMQIQLDTNEAKEVVQLVVPVRGRKGIEWKQRRLTEAKREVEREKAKLLADLNRFEANLAKIKHDFKNDYFRDRPLVDFIDPLLEPKQIVIEDLRDDYYFAQIRKVDRCETCHLAMDKGDFKGWLVNIKGEGMVAVANVEPVKGKQQTKITRRDGRTEVLDHTQLVGEPRELEHPYTAHPRLDLFLSDMSPHPKLQFGCTICHEGEGRSMDFLHSAHTPSNHEQEEKWHHELDWHKRHHWDNPQIRTQYLESSCLLCHDNNRPVEKAPKLNFGREVWERASCYGCHKMKGYTEEAKPGPDLRKVASKLTKGFMYQWLENPSAFRPKTMMPRFWFGALAGGYSGHASGGGAEAEAKNTEQSKRDTAEIVAVTEYLYEVSKPFRHVDGVDGPRGSAESGAALYREKGCTGCHNMDASDTVERPRAYTPNEFGPNLHNIGAKVSYEWLYSWVKNPRHYWADTNMPDLQLSESEAHDIAAFLSTRKGEDTIRSEAPKADSETLKTLVSMYLDKAMSPSERERVLAGEAGEFIKFDEMAKGLNLGNERDRLLYLGRNVVTRFGCYGCHLVGGMETRPGIGAELSDIGDKRLDKVDWGHTTEHELPRMREDWMRFKVKNPRYTDEGKSETLAYLDRSRMPHFNLTSAERESLVTWLSGHRNKEIPKHYKYQPAARKKQQIDGAYLVQRKNCKACHRFEVDEITLSRRAFPEEPDEEEVVDGKTLEAWVEQLDADDPAKVVAAIPALAKGGHFGPLREKLQDMDDLADLEGSELTNAITLRKTLVEALGSAPVETVKVKGLVLMDNRWQRDADGSIKLDEQGRPVPAVRATEEGQTIKGPDGKAVDAFGAAIVQLWEDGAGKKAGSLIPVAANPAAEPSVFYADILEINPTAKGGAAKIPEELRERYPSDFRKTNAKVSMAGPTRLRGGASISELAWARTIAKLGNDPRSLGGADFEVGGITRVSEALIDGISYAAPHLRNEGEKVQAVWLRSFLKSPTARIRPWLSMRMPHYGFTDVEAQSLAQYFSALDQNKTVSEALDRLAAIKNRMKVGKAKGETWDRARIAGEVSAALDPLGAREYFSYTIADGVLNWESKGDVSIPDPVEEKTDAYQLARESENPYWYSRGHEMFVAAQCLSCHIWEGRTPGKDDPSSWGPDLSRVQHRIRPGWFQKWVHEPASIIPGTKMSKQFGPGKYRDVFDAGPEKQIELLKDWIFAGMKIGFEAFPAELKGGGEVRVTSHTVPIENVEVLYLTDPSGKVTKLSVSDGNLKREKSDARAGTFVFRVGSAAGDWTVSTTPPGKPQAGDRSFQAKAKIKVTK